MKAQRLFSYVRRATDDYNMINDGDKIAVGISGGKDSLTLLYALNGLKRFYPKKFDVVAIMHLADLALVLTGDHHHLVVFMNTKLFHSLCSYSTSGARDTIFMKLRARSSRATGPKIRVPTGSPCLVRSTAAFVSNLM